MRTLRSTDTCIGLGMVALAVVIVLLARTFPSGSPNVPGPAVFPLLMAGLGGIIGLALIATGFRQNESSDATITTPGPERRRIAAVLMATVAYAFVMPHAGFVSSSTAWLAVLMLLLGYPHKARATALAFVVAHAIFALFAGVMNVPLPAGWLG